MRFACVSALVLLCAGAVGLAQDKGPTASTTDPRVGLKPGLKDAGIAAKNMELVATLFKPEGFFDPKNPGGLPMPPERPEGAGNADAVGAACLRRHRLLRQRRRAARAPPVPGGLDFANSDIAFSGTHMFLGNFNGFQTYDIERANKPRLLASVVCPGGQGDMSVWGDLLIMSVEQTRGRLDCGIGGVALPSSPERFRGIRIFDIKDLQQPEAGGRRADLPRFAHAHDRRHVRRQVESLHLRFGHRPGALGDELAGCSGGDPKENPETALFSIDVIEVPLAAPAERQDRQPPAYLCRRRQGGRHVDGRRSRSRHAAHERDQPVPRHHGVSRRSASRPAHARATAS